MDFATYKNLVNHIDIGKHLPEALYLHQSALSLIPTALIDFLNHTITSLGIENVDYTLVKFFTRDFKLSLLDYPDFFSHPYPTLQTSCTIDLQTGKHRLRSYATSKNPPILHRKETFLPPNHTKVPEFRALTTEAEQAGLFEKPQSIGFKQNWERLIKQKGYKLQNGHISPVLN